MITTEPTLSYHQLSVMSVTTNQNSLNIRQSEFKKPNMIFLHQNNHDYVMLVLMIIDNRENSLLHFISQQLVMVGDGGNIEMSIISTWLTARVNMITIQYAL